jgi:metal-dependent amidase/aminoacylase/carboxypeptidase family protein
MGKLSEKCLGVARGLADAHGLTIESEWLEEFPCTESDASVNEIVERAARGSGLPVVRRSRPFAWTEDFGHFTERFGGAMFGLGSGEDNAPLHHPDYRFPENLVTVGARLFRDTIDIALETEGFWTQDRA